MSFKQNLRTELDERLKFETLVSDLCARFVNVANDLVDAEILDCQRQICECLGLDACALWQSQAENSNVHVLTHLYRPLGGPPAPERMDAQEYFPWCRQQLLAGNVIVVSSLDTLPPEAARDIESWRYFGAKTSLTFPLSAAGGPVFGFLSFNDLQTERLWPSATVNRLRLIAQIMANALARKRADEGLRENEERFRGLAESALVGFYVLENGRYVYVNPAMARVFGYSVEEMTGMTPREIVQSCDHSMVGENIRRRITGEVRAMQYQVRGRHKDGSTRDVEVYGTTVVTKRGPALVGTLIDITERKRALDALKQSEIRFRQVSETVADFIWEVDANGLYTYASASVARILGYSSDDLVGKVHFYDLFAPEVREDLKAAAFRAFGARQCFRNFAHPNVTKDGRIVDLETSGVPIVNDAGELTGYRGADTDVTDRNRAEEALRESEELNRSTFEQAAVGIAHVREDGRILRANERLCSLLGYSRRELLQLTFQDLTYREDLEKDLEYLYQVLSGKIKTYSTEKRYLHRDRSIVWASLTVSLVRAATGEPKYFIAVVEDITERKRAEDELRNLSARLITAHEQERTWIARELHDGISQHLALLSIELDRLQQDPPERTGIGERLEKLHRRAEEMLDDVRRLSHGLHPSLLEQLGFVAALTNYCREIQTAGDISIRFTAQNVPRELPHDISLCLYRVAQEALQNVVRHSGADVATVEVMVRENELRMRIADNGKGFDQAARAADSLGLVGMRERIGLVQGKLKLETAPGQGTVVDVCVPVKACAPPVAPR